MASVSPSRVGIYVKPGRGALTRQITITNSGNADLIFDPTASRVGGSGRRNFAYGEDFPETPFTIAPGADLTLNLTGQLFKGQTATAGATLYLATNDPANPTLGVILRAFNANTTPQALRAPAGVSGAGPAASLMDELNLRG